MPATLNFNVERFPENQFVANFSNGVSLFIKREDLLHPVVSGNKFRKLKYNLRAAKDQNFKSLMTFGGAYSNHIAATAAAGKLAGFRTIGIIRGEELGKDLAKTLEENPTLKFANSCGMELHFISRKEYRQKDSEAFLENLMHRYGTFYLIPEGGTNRLAVKGCEEILSQTDTSFNFVCCSVGTGGTMAGLINASGEKQQVLGFPALKGDFLFEEVSQLSNKNNWDLILKYHFGGYAKVNSELINFINIFRKKYHIQLDPVYTGKLVFGIFDLINSGFFPKGSQILAIHSGGLQGISGINNMLKRKNLPLIEI